MFGEKLRRIMQEMNLTQAQVAGLTGCSKAAISQYLSGKNVPGEEKRRDIAVSLGLNPDHFEREDRWPREMASGKHIPRMSVTEAADALGLHHVTVRKGLQQGVFPWGYAIKTSGNRWVYFINAKRFLEIEGALA